MRGGPDRAAAPLAMWLVPGREPERPLKGRVHDLYPGVPDNRLFPLETWRRLVSSQLRRSRLDDLTYVGRGHRRLREEVARHLGLARSVACSGEDVIVTVGAQQAIDLVARVLVEPGTVVAVEDPGYSAAHRPFETHRAVVRGVPVDREGLVVDALPDDARVVYVTPSHQFPTGVAMSLARRAALLRWAAHHDAAIVEDDYDSEFALRPPARADPEPRPRGPGHLCRDVLQVADPGSAGRLPRRAAVTAAALREARRGACGRATSSRTAPGRLHRRRAPPAHVRRASRVYGERRSQLLAELSRLDDVLEVVPSVAGLHVCALP